MNELKLGLGIKNQKEISKELMLKVINIEAFANKIGYKIFKIKNTTITYTNGGNETLFGCNHIDIDFKKTSIRFSSYTHQGNRHCIYANIEELKLIKMLYELMEENLDKE